MIRPILNKTPYELFKGRKPNIMHLRIFGCKCYVHNNGKDALGKFDLRSDEAIFLGYFSHCKAYKIFNKRTLCVEESGHVLFDKSNSLSENDVQDEDFELGLTKKDCLQNHGEAENPQDGSGIGPDSKPETQAFEQIRETSAEPCLEQKTADNSESGARTGTEIGPVTVSKSGSPDNQAEDRPISRSWKHQKSHPLDQIVTDLNSEVQTRSRLKNFCAFYAFFSLMEPKNVYEALTDSDWIVTLQDELHQFDRNQV